jgi:hypothetical protein
MRYNLRDLVEVGLTRYEEVAQVRRWINVHTRECKLNRMQDRVEEVVMNICKDKKQN